jgi:hypothetical protein
MKKIITIITFLTILISFNSCKKEAMNLPSGSNERYSRILLDSTATWVAVSNRIPDNGDTTIVTSPDSSDIWKFSFNSNLLTLDYTKFPANVPNTFHYQMSNDTAYELNTLGQPTHSGFIVTDTTNQVLHISKYNANGITRYVSLIRG